MSEYLIAFGVPLGTALVIGLYIGVHDLVVARVARREMKLRAARAAWRQRVEVNKARRTSGARGAM